MFLFSLASNNNNNVSSSSSSRMGGYLGKTMETQFEKQQKFMMEMNKITLERQIEYGSKEGQIDLDMAKLELRNFRKNVIPGAEYFDYKRLLYVVRK